MRAKMKITHVTQFEGGQEKLKFTCVSKSGSYPVDGTDEDNTFAKWTPSGECELMISNPSLYGKFKTGMKFYVDFTEVEQ